MSPRAGVRRKVAEACAAAAVGYMPCRRHGGVGDERGCEDCQREKRDRLTPGESGRELSPSQSIEALSEALLDITGEPRVKFSNVQDIEVRMVGKWVVITVTHDGAETNRLTFRISRQWGQVLCARLGQAMHL